MSPLNIYAFTAVEYDGSYPPYISVNQTGDDTIEITVRSSEADGGATAKIALSKWGSIDTLHMALTSLLFPGKAA